MTSPTLQPFGEVSCRTTGYMIQQYQKMRLPAISLTCGLPYTLDELQTPSASITWDAFLILLGNIHERLSPSQQVELYTSYQESQFLRPLLSAAGLCLDPARYFAWIAEPESGVLQQLFRCLATQFKRTSKREVLIEEFLRPGFTLPPDIFWESQAIGLQSLTTHFGLSPSIVTWEPIDCGAAFRILLPRRRPVRYALAWLANLVRRDATEDLQRVLSDSHQARLRLECDIAERKRIEQALQENKLQRELRSRDDDSAERALDQLKLESVRGEQFYRLCELAGQGIGIARLEGALTYMNPVFRRLLELPSDADLNRLTFWEFVPAEQHQFLAETVLTATRETGFWSGEFDLLTKSGKRVPIINTVFLLRSPDGTVHGYSNIVTDITELKKTEQALRESETRQRLALDAAQMGTWEWDVGSEAFTSDEREQSLFGFEPGEFDGRIESFHSRIHPEDLPAIQQIHNEAVNGKGFEVEFRICLASGKVRWIHGTGAVIPANEEHPARLVGINYDITARKIAEQSLLQSKELLRIFIENAPAGVAMFDCELKYIAHSRRWLIDYELGDQNLVGRSHYEVFPEVPDRWKEIHRRCLTGIAERCDEDRFERADGTIEYLRWEIQPWRDAAGEIGGLVFFTESISERVRAEERIRASLREKESLLREIHHRVKNNLQVISSLLSLQSSSVSHPAAIEVLSESQNRVRAMSLVHETLYRSNDLARVNLSCYFGELCENLFRAFGVDAARIHLELDVAPVIISLDKSIPCGLLVNEIVSNSLKYAFPDERAGNITVRLQAEPDSRVKLILADDGVGILPAIDITQTNTLGLQLVSILTEQLGGHLSIDRSGGTRFEISFTP